MPSGVSPTGQSAGAAAPAASANGRSAKLGKLVMAQASSNGAAKRIGVRGGQVESGPGSFGSELATAKAAGSAGSTSAGLSSALGKAVTPRILRDLLAKAAIWASRVA